MQRFSNRTTFESFVRSVSYDETTVILGTDGGSFVVPRNTLTSKIVNDPEFPYTFEVDNSTKILCGIVSPEGSTLYRLNDSQVFQITQTPEHLSRLTLGGLALDLNEALGLMMENVEEIYIERLRNLPQDYLNRHYLYEVKISYLASDLEKPVIFDTTPAEIMHSMALATSQSSTYPPFILNTY